MSTSDDDKLKEDLKKAEEVEKKLNKFALSLSGLSFFDLIEKMYEWSMDQFPDIGFWGHISDASDLISSYIDLIQGEFDSAPVNSEFEGQITKFDVAEKIKGILALFVNILGKILTTLVKGATMILKTLYDTFCLFLKTIGALIGGLSKEINIVIKTIGNAIALIKKLWSDGEKFSWDIFCEKFKKWLNAIIEKYKMEIRTMLTEMVFMVWDMFVAAVKPTWEAIKQIWNELKKYADMLDKENPLKELIKQFLNDFFGPFLDMINQILVLFFNTIKNFSGTKEINGGHKFYFTSDTVKGSDGVFVNVVLNIDKDGSASGKYFDKEDRNVYFQNVNLGWKYEDKKVVINPSIPGYLKSTKLKSESEIEDKYILGSFLTFKEDFNIDVWGMIDEYAKVAEQHIKLAIKKLEALINAVAQPLLSTFLPHSLTKTGSSDSSFPKNLTGYQLTYPSVSVNLGESTPSPSPKIIFIKKAEKTIEGKFIPVEYKCNWEKQSCFGAFKKDKEDVIFNIPGNQLSLKYLNSISGCHILLTPEQYKYIKILKNLLELPKIAFNTVALAFFGTIYIATIQIKMAMEAAETILSIIGLKFTDVINQMNTLLNTEDDITFFDHMDDVFEWPTFDDFPGNPLKDINFDVDFSPITNEF